MESLKAHEVLRQITKDGNFVLIITDCKGVKLKVTMCKKMVSKCEVDK